MSDVLTTTDDVLKTLGGTLKAAQRLGKTPQSVSNWRARKSIPPELYLVISDLLVREGKTVDPSVFRMTEPDASPSPESVS